MLNKVIMIGRVGNVETKTLDNGQHFTKLSIAVNKKWKDKTGAKQEKTTWFNIHAYSKLAEIMAEYTSVGHLVYVEGELKQDKYTDKTGIEKIITSIVANEYKILSGRDKDTSQAPGKPATVKEPTYTLDDMPW